MVICKACDGGGLIDVEWKGAEIIKHKVCIKCGGHGTFWDESDKMHVPTSIEAWFSVT
jgi:DnaJ-class molecular chaperone